MTRLTMNRAFLLTIVAPVLCGCQMAGPDPRAETAPAAGEPELRASAGCGGPTPMAAGSSESFTLEVGTLEREYLVHLPAGYDPARPTSLILDFHGYTGTAASEEVYTGLSEHADEHGYVVVYPQGTGLEHEGRWITSWNDLAGSRSPGPEGPICADDAVVYPFPPECGERTPCNWATCHDDLAFVAALLDRLAADLCVDLDRVYATGMSNGGMFAHRLGCDMAERFAAIAPVGGTMARGFSCAPSTPLAMMNIYGRADDYVSQRGDRSSDGYYYEAAERVMADWAEAQACEPEVTPYPTSRDGDLGLECVQHAGCATGAEVVHCTWDGGHDWPQAEGLAVGNDVIWEFFSRHRRRSLADRSTGG